MTLSLFLQNFLHTTFILIRRIPKPASWSRPQRSCPHFEKETSYQRRRCGTLEPQNS